MIATSSQRAAFETLLAMGNLYFSGRRTLPKIKLRLQPLIIGATGCGKSFLVENAARRLQAKYFRITRGDWIPYGSKGPRPTVFRILDEVATFDRVVLHIDELDKFGNLQEREWSAAIASDLWNVLDGRFQLGEYLRETMFPEGKKPQRAGAGTSDPDVTLDCRFRNLAGCLLQQPWASDDGIPKRPTVR